MKMRHVHEGEKAAASRVLPSDLSHLHLILTLGSFVKYLNMAKIPLKKQKAK